MGWPKKRQTCDLICCCWLALKEEEEGQGPRNMGMWVVSKTGKLSDHSQQEKRDLITSSNYILLTTCNCKDLPEGNQALLKTWCWPGETHAKLPTYRDIHWNIGWLQNCKIISQFVLFQQLSVWYLVIVATEN